MPARNSNSPPRNFVRTSATVRQLTPQQIAEQQRLEEMQRNNSNFERSNRQRKFATSMPILNRFQSYSPREFTRRFLEIKDKLASTANIEQLVEKMIYYNEFILIPTAVLNEIIEAFQNKINEILDIVETGDIGQIAEISKEYEIEDMSRGYVTFDNIRDYYMEILEDTDKNSLHFRLTMIRILREYLKNGFLYEFSIYVAVNYFNNHMLDLNDFINYLESPSLPKVTLIHGERVTELVNYSGFEEFR